MHLYQKKHTKHLKYITKLQLNHPSISKRSTGCTRHDLVREHSVLLSVSHMFYVNQVCHSVGRCVKDGNCSSSNLE